MIYSYKRILILITVVLFSCLFFYTNNSIAAAQVKARIIINKKILVLPNLSVPLPIQYKAPNGLPPHTFLRIKNLPPPTILTEGYQVSQTTWSIPLDRLEKLQVRYNEKTPVDKILLIQIVSLDGKVYAEETVHMVSKIKLSAPPLLASRGVAERGNDKRQLLANVMSATANLAIGNTASEKKRELNLDNSNDSNTVTVVPSSRLLVRKPKDKHAAGRFLARGNQFLLQGNVNTARLFYRRAADLGFSAAAMALAATFDPNELAGLGIVGMQGNVQQAVIWYKRAVELGEPVANDRLKRLLN